MIDSFQNTRLKVWFPVYPIEREKDFEIVFFHKYHPFIQQFRQVKMMNPFDRENYLFSRFLNTHKEIHFKRFLIVIILARFHPSLLLPTKLSRHCVDICREMFTSYETQFPTNGCSRL